MSLEHLHTETIWKSNFYKVESLFDVPIEDVPYTSLGSDFHGVSGSHSDTARPEYGLHLQHADKALPNGAYILTNGSQPPNIEGVRTIHAKYLLIKQIPPILNSMFVELGIHPPETAFATDSKSESMSAIICGVGHIFLVNDPELKPHPAEAIWRKTFEPAVFRLGRKVLHLAQS